LVNAQTPGRNGMMHWRLDVQAIRQDTGVQWPEWETWVDRVERNEQRMRDYCAAQSLECPSWFKSFWEMGNMVRQSIGYRIRILEEMDGTTMYDDFVSALETHPERLARADALAKRLSASNMLSELLASGHVTAKGVLVWVDVFRRDTIPLIRFLGMEPETVSLYFTGECQARPLMSSRGKRTRGTASSGGFGSNLWSGRLSVSEMPIRPAQSCSHR
jgi:hypothetical protein